MKQSILKTKFSPAFTLIELIITIVILAILATIAFLSFNNYNSSARDSNRLADFNSLNKGIELYQINSGYYPTPEGTISTGTIYGVDVVYKGIIGDDISSNLIKVSKTPKDPLSNSNYVYGISYDKKYFQVGIVLEASSNKSSFDNIITEAIAGSGAGNYFSKIKGNYMGVIKFSSGTTTKSYYLANIPSLLYNSGGVTNLLNTGTYYIANNNTNLAYQIDPNVTINNKTSDVIIKEVTNKTGASLTGVDITSIVNAVDSSSRNSLINSMFSGSLLDSFGGNVGLVGSVVSGGSSNSNSTPTILSKTTCKEWYNIGNTSSGVYLIDPDGNGPIQAENIYCKMSGGQWALLAGIKSNGEGDSNVDSGAITGDLTNYNDPSGKVSDDFINALMNSGRKELAIENFLGWKIQITAVPEGFTSGQAYYYNNCTFNSDTNLYGISGNCNPCHRSGGSYSLCYYPNNGGTLQNTTSGSPGWNNGRLWVR